MDKLFPSEENRTTKQQQELSKSLPCSEEKAQLEAKIKQTVGLLTNMKGRHNNKKKILSKVESKTKDSKFLKVLKAEQKTVKSSPPKDNQNTQSKQERGLSKLNMKMLTNIQIITVHTEPEYKYFKLKATSGIKKFMLQIPNVLNTIIWLNTQ